MILRHDEVEGLLRARYQRLDDEPGLDFEVLERLALHLAAGDQHADDRGDSADRGALLEEPEVAGVLLDYARSEPAPAAVSRRPAWVRPAVTALAIAAFAMFALWRPSVLVEPEVPRSTLTPKGAQLDSGDRFAVAVEREGRTWRVQSGETLRTGDALGLFYSTERESWLLVAHVDAVGDVTWLAPADGVSSTQRPAGRDVPLPTGARLTEATGCQWFVAVFTDDAMDVPATGEVLSAAALAADQCQLSIELPEARSVRVLGIRR